MSLLTESEAQQIADAISSLEHKTDAELITVLAHQADEYHYIPSLWAALIALVSPGIVLFTPYWLEIEELLIIQLLVFVILALTLRLPPILRRIIPKKVKQWRASNLARRQFLENNLHHTKDETGLLIFVSETERYVEIIADRGISNRVTDDEWQTIVNDFTELVRKGKTAEGFLTTIEQCGEILIKHFPATSQKNELPNHLIII